MSDHTIVVIWVIKIFFWYSFVYSCHLFLISSASVTSILFLSFIVPIFAWNVPLVSLIFLKRSLVFPILLFSCIPFSCFPVFLCIVHWGRLSYLFLHFFGTLYSDGYTFLFLLCLSLLYFSQLFVRPPQNSHFTFLDFFFLGMALITTSYTMLRTSVHSSTGTLSIRSNPLNPGSVL